MKTTAVEKRTDHLGNIYPTRTAMCEAWGKSLVSVTNRVDKLGWTLEEALTSDTGIRKITGIERRTDHLGNVYPTRTAMCKAWGKGITLVNKRVDEWGWTLEEALTKVSDKGSSRRQAWAYNGKTYSKKELCDANGISINTLNRRLAKGLSVKQALSRTYREMHGKDCEDHLGNTYTSRIDMCAEYNMTVGQLENRLNLGWSLKDALETPIEERNYERTDHLGNKHMSLRAMCEYYNISLHAYYSRQEAGWSLQAILTEPSIPQIRKEFPTLKIQSKNIIAIDNHVYYPCTCTKCKEKGFRTYKEMRNHKCS